MACNQGLPSVKNICGPQLNDKTSRIKLTFRDSQAKKSRTFVASHPRLIRWYFWNALTPRISKQPLNTYRCKYFHKKILILYILWSFGTFDFAEFKRRVILSTSKVQLNGGAFITYIFFCLCSVTQKLLVFSMGEIKKVHCVS